MESKEYRCKLEFCKKLEIDEDRLIAHLKRHIRFGVPVACPYAICGSRTEYRVVSSFSSHLHRHHSIRRSIHEVSEHREDVETTVASSADTDSVTQTIVDAGKERFGLVSETDLEKLEKRLELFYAKLQYQHLTPASSINKILQEHKDLQRAQNSYIESVLMKSLTNNGVSATASENIHQSVQEAFLQLPIETAGLHSAFIREKSYINDFYYVEPSSYVINETDSSCFEYVPIFGSVKALFKRESVRKQFLHPPQKTNCYTDFRDGSVFLKNPFFSKCSNFPKLQVILYQDSFEVVNPIGHSKKKHKMLGVYFTLGNIYPSNRCTVNSIQLCMLVKERFVNIETSPIIFKPLLDDLKTLESVGIDLGFSENILGSVIAILGDNLGSNWLGGFVTNFGSSSHFCRHCRVHRSDFHVNPLKCAEIRTVASYQEAISLSTGMSNYLGIKHSSIFNELNHFHVVGGLPPCVAHDIFEGVLQYDMILFINYFVSKNWFSIQSLNDRILNFKYLGPDRNSKPAPVKSGSSRLDGNAAQNWAFLRLFPILVIHNVEDVEDPIWHLLLLLKEIVEICTAPIISQEMIAYLDVITAEYLHYRAILFPLVPLRPKHHFLTHYSYLTSVYGPLVRSWTLRFESKHSYFKRVAKRSQNFKNIEKLLAKNHQLLQSCILEDLFTNDQKNFEGNFKKFPVNLSAAYKNCITDSDLSIEKCQFLTKINNNGTIYEDKQFVVIGKDGAQILVGQILSLFRYGDRNLALICKSIAEYYPHYSLYLLRMRESQLAVYELKDLIDYHQLCVYHEAGHHLFSLHHALP